MHRIHCLEPIQSRTLVRRTALSGSNRAEVDHFQVPIAINPDIVSSMPPASNGEPAPVHPVCRASRCPARPRRSRPCNTELQGLRMTHCRKSYGERRALDRNSSDPAGKRRLRPTSRPRSPVESPLIPWCGARKFGTIRMRPEPWASARAMPRGLCYAL